ncbi:MAG: hypothetical protein ACRC2K_08220 [Clostridium sp.]
MPNSIGIFKMYPESFRANVYSLKPFRMIGLIDVDIIFKDNIEKVTLVYFRSSGTNSGKIKGLWYPIVGIKIHDGPFDEFTKFLNRVLTHTTRNGQADRGWLAKSLFFVGPHIDNSKIRGFSNGMHHKSLLWIGETLRELYERGEYKKDYSLVGDNINKIVTSKEVYENNKNSQRKNFEMLIDDIYRRY